jgi:hypothetical protein
VSVSRLDLGHPVSGRIAEVHVTELPDEQAAPAEYPPLYERAPLRSCASATIHPRRLPFRPAAFFRRHEFPP